MKLLLLALAAAPLALLGCTPDTAVESASAADTSLDAAYTFAFLLAGPREGRLSAEELQAARNGHFGNMQRLAGEGVLLIAGPLSDPRSDLAHRGIFVFDLDDIDEARAIAETDPGVQLGAFELAIYPFRSPSNLRRALELDLAALAETERDPGVPGPGTRPYVLATARADAALPAIEHLERAGRAFFHGTFGGELAGTALVALDARLADEAEALLAEARDATGRDVEWTLHGWFSTANVEALAGD